MPRIVRDPPHPGSGFGRAYRDSSVQAVCVATWIESGKGILQKKRGRTHRNVFVDEEDPVRIATLSLTNGTTATRRLSVFAYNDWVLGPPREGDSRHVVTE